MLYSVSSYMFIHYVHKHLSPLRKKYIKKENSPLF
nr:MAG TPA: hypothetical protein [Caudoviricetes sp.]